LTAIKRLRETKKPFHRMRNDCSIHAAVRAQHSQFAAGQGGEFGELHCKLCKQCRSNPVSGQSLPKTGVFSMYAGDYRLFRAQNARNRNRKTGAEFAEARHWRAITRGSGQFSLSSGLPGWRRSADRTCLHEISLLTGNFTGKFAISRC
jgi:hypothetical protein